MSAASVYGARMTNDPPPLQRAAASVELVQRRIRRVLVATQVLGGLGVGAGVAVTTLLAFQLSGSAALAGLAASASAFGAGLSSAGIGALARYGRRPGLVGGYLLGALGAGTAITAAVVASFPLMVLATFAFGASNASNLQARYAVADLALPGRRARDLSTVVWATTVGAVLGPNLTGPGARVAGVLALPELAGPYLLSATGFLAAAIVMGLGLRPDPLLLARRVAERLPGQLEAGHDGGGPGRAGIVGALVSVRSDPSASAAAATIAAAHAVMVGVMVMTPVHMGGHGASVQLIGLTISLHIAGMYALSPVFGHLADRYGTHRVLGLGFVQLALAVVLAAGGTAHGGIGFMSGLVLLGSGWSACLIASSALLTAALSVEERAPAQGFVDLLMNVAGGTAGAVSGLIMTLLGFPALALITLGLLLVPALLVLRDAPRVRPVPAH
jgi:MFS family permease